MKWVFASVSAVCVSNNMHMFANNMKEANSSRNRNSRMPEKLVKSCEVLDKEVKLMMMDFKRDMSDANFTLTACNPAMKKNIFAYTHC